MRIVSVVAALLTILALAAPAMAHHRPGHDPPGQRGRDSGDSHHGGPPSGPGNSGAAHWCQAHWWDAEDDQGQRFRNHGHCVSFYAHQRAGQDEADEENEVGVDHGDLTIADVRIRRDGTFRVRGFGAEGLTFASISRGADVVVASGQDQADAEGDFEIEGHWACIDTDSTQEARLRVQDFNESTGKTVRFPCGELER